MESTPSFVARDGLPLQGVLLVPAVSDSTALPAVVLVHGFSGTRLDLVPWGRELARRGFTALCIDTRGSGMEWSHGWNQTTGDTSLTYQVNDNFAVGNYLGIRADGTYSPSFINAPGNTGVGKIGTGVA